MKINDTVAVIRKGQKTWGVIISETVDNCWVVKEQHDITIFDKETLQCLEAKNNTVFRLDSTTIREMTDEEEINFVKVRKVARIKAYLDIAYHSLSVADLEQIESILPPLPPKKEVKIK